MTNISIDILILLEHRSKELGAARSNKEGKDIKELLEQVLQYVSDLL
jgi:hypothetical protein